jgi:transposase
VISVYWIPILFELIDGRGFAVFLVNARDAGFSSFIFYGLLRANFRPKGQIAELRAYVRQGERLLDYPELINDFTSFVIMEPLCAI